MRRTKENPAELLVLGNPRKRNPAELLVMGNPRKRSSRGRRNGSSAEALYEDFHQRESDETLAVNTPQKTPKKMAVLGDLEALGFGIETVHGDKLHADRLAEGWKHCSHISFAGSDVKVASDAPKGGFFDSVRGTQIYFIGGRQELSVEQLNQFTGRRKGIVSLGPCYFIVYNTRKEADGGNFDGYCHEFGEEGGRRPTAYYDTATKQILLRGGSYEVRGEGIVN